MTDPTDEHILGDLPELPEHVWTAALDHAFDPRAEPDTTLVPADDLTGLDGDDPTVTGLDDLAYPDHDATGTSHDPFDHGYDSHDSSDYHHDHGYQDHGYQDDSFQDHGYDPGTTDSDGYF